MSNNYTVLDFLNNSLTDENGHKIDVENGIEIPMIQRDYAQGRLDDKTTYIREKFLGDILHAIKKNKKMNLDFVYGYSEGKTFIPLDGQQRITTLYIISWFLAFKDKCLESIPFNKFTYVTRQSSKEFFKNLNKKENFERLFEDWEESEKSLSKIIQQQPWFSTIWKLDPTVNGILTTLEDVEHLFSEISFETFSESKSITFHILEIDDFGLSDNLYIKMNARGKPLSDFENFKASFEKIISIHANFRTFADRIDGIWLNSFWKYAKDSKLCNENEVKKLSGISDNFLLNFLKKITEYLFYLSNPIPNTRFQFTDRNVEAVYSVESNFNLLIQLFDLLTAKSLEQWESYFNTLFSEKHEGSKLALHQKEFNLFYKILAEQNFSRFEDLMFFGWLNFISQRNSSTIDEQLLDGLRIVRNVINNINQKKKTSLDTELREDYYVDILKLINKIDINKPYETLTVESTDNWKKYLQFEIDKFQVFKDSSEIKKLLFKLEDHPQLKGLIFNFNLVLHSEKELQNIVDNFYDLFDNVDYRNIIRLLTCFGDYAVTITSYSKIGVFKYLGYKDKWHRILASPDGEIKSNLELLLNLIKDKKIDNWTGFIKTEINKIINNYENSWYWYFLNDNYVDILNLPVFTINDQTQNLREIEIFEVDKPSLMAFHFNPFVYFLRQFRKEELKGVINIADSCALYGKPSYLHLNNGIQLEQWDKKWYLQKNILLELTYDFLKFDKEHNQLYFDCNNLIDDAIPLIKKLSLTKIVTND